MASTLVGEENHPPPPADCCTLMGLPIDRVTEREAIDRILTASAAGQGGWVVTPNVDILRQVVRDPEERALVEAATLRLADGTPLLWASRLQGDPLPERITGATLMWSLSRAAAAAGAPVFLLGAGPGVAEKASDALQAAIPGLVITGCHCPPLGFEKAPEHVNAIMDAIVQARPRIVFCCLGSLKQERLLRRLAEVFPTIWFLGTGAALDFAAGKTVRAPLWLQRAGLEWLHRLVHEPRRLFKRYVVHDAPFAVQLLARSALQLRARSGASRVEWQQGPRLGR